MKEYTTCKKRGGNTRSKSGLPRTIKALCGKTYAIQQMADRHNKVYHHG